MEPKIIEKPELNVVGINSTAKSVFDMEIGSYWNDFEKYSDLIKNSDKKTGYEIHIDDETANIHHCFVGVEIKKIEDVPIELVVKIMPKAKYAVFTHSFKNGGFDAVYNEINEWLEASTYKALPYEIQVYDSRFKGPNNPESELDYWIPIKEK